MTVCVRNYCFSSFCQNKMRKDMILCENYNAIQIIRYREKVEGNMLLNINSVILMLRHKCTMSMCVASFHQHSIFILTSIVYPHVLLLWVSRTRFVFRIWPMTCVIGRLCSVPKISDGETHVNICRKY